MENARADVIFAWGEEGENVIKAAEQVVPFNGTLDNFLDHCIACGGNWGGMLLSGLKKLYPAVWDAIPDNMGAQGWIGIVATLQLCGVEW